MRAGTTTREEKERVDRLQDWMCVVIETRIAQITQPQTEHSKALVAQYEAAVATYERERERVASDYPGDLAIYDAEHERPTMKAFLVDQRQRVEQAKACDCPMIIDHRPDCPLGGA